MPTTNTLLTGAPATSSSSAAPDGLSKTTDRPILVATDGSESADAAFIAARLLAHRCGAPVEVLAVSEPVLVHLPSAFQLAPAPDGEVLRMTELRDRARAQLAAQVGEDTGWHVEIRSGEAAPTIQRAATDRKVGLLVTGLTRHGVLDRIYDEETNAHIIELSTVPVLTVAAGMDRLPRSIVVAIEPHTAALVESVHIATLLSEVTSAHFICVAPATMEMGLALPTAPWDPSYATDVQAAYDRVRESLHLPPMASTKLEMLVGTPEKEILRVAAELKADLIIVGRRRRSIIRRWIDKGLATRLLRGATCSVLVIPRPASVRADTPSTAGRTETIADPKEWPARLADLSRRNSGRRVALEVDDPALGAQAQATNYPFLGMFYDPMEDRILIMLGNPEGGTAHITHAISAPVALEVLDARNGSTLVIRVEEALGQTLLMFVL